jgi:hypothetical protein
VSHDYRFEDERIARGKSTPREVAFRLISHVWLVAGCVAGEGTSRGNGRVTCRMEGGDRPGCGYRRSGGGIGSESSLLCLVAVHGASAHQSWLVILVEMRNRIDSGCLARRLLMCALFSIFNDQVATICFGVHVLYVIPMRVLCNHP